MIRIIISGVDGNRVYNPIGFENPLVITGGNSQTIVEGENADKLMADKETWNLIKNINRHSVSIIDNQFEDTVETVFETEKVEDSENSEDDEEKTPEMIKPKRKYNRG
jgi:hypothetical protein